jgi:hypothetical protein
MHPTTLPLHNSDSRIGLLASQILSCGDRSDYYAEELTTSMFQRPNFVFNAINTQPRCSIWQNALIDELESSLISKWIFKNLKDQASSALPETTLDIIKNIFIKDKYQTVSVSPSLIDSRKTKRVKSIRPMNAGLLMWLEAAKSEDEG